MHVHIYKHAHVGKAREEIMISCDRKTKRHTLTHRLKGGGGGMEEERKQRRRGNRRENGGGHTLTHTD